MQLITTWKSAIFEDVRGYTLNLSEVDVEVGSEYSLLEEFESLKEGYFLRKRNYVTKIYIEGEYIELRNTPIEIYSDFDSYRIVIKPEDEDRVYEFLEPLLDLFAIR